MKTEWDPDKNEKNREKHGLDFADFEGFDDEPIVVEDTRKDYGEVRYRAFGTIAGRGYSLTFTIRGEAMRLISWRSAKTKEIRRYDR